MSDFKKASASATESKSENPAVTSTGSFPRPDSKSYSATPNPVRKDPRAQPQAQAFSNAPGRVTVSESSPRRFLTLCAVAVVCSLGGFTVAAHLQPDRPPELTEAEKIEKRLERLEATLTVMQNNLQQMQVRIGRLESTSAEQCQRVGAIQGYISSHP
jgi:hypothetical protein